VYASVCQGGVGESGHTWVGTINPPNVLQTGGTASSRLCIRPRVHIARVKRYTLVHVHVTRARRKLTASLSLRSSSVGWAGVAMHIPIAE
jgi:hypothetical protein